MAVEVKLSSLGVSIVEGTIVRWVKQEGDKVDKGEILAEVETEKVNFEIIAPESGTLLKIFYPANTVAKVNATVALIGAPGEDISAYPEMTVAIGIEVKTTQEAVIKTDMRVVKGVMAFPAAKMLAKKHGVDIAEVAGTGPDGRVTKEDVERYISQQKAAKESERIPELEEVLPFVGIRKTIADAMSLSVRTAAHVTTVAEVDMTEVVRLRAEIAPRWKKEGINLTYVPFVIQAAVSGIKHFPVINSQILDDSIIIKKYINLGVVVAIKEGLVTPVIKRVENKNLKEISKELENLSLRAKDRKLTLDDMQGGTITLSNPGVFGAVLATPIIYPPQNAILWMGRIAKTPVVRDDSIVIRSMMYLCLSYDHRAIDGSMAAQFLQHLRKSLEDPTGLQME